MGCEKAILLAGSLSEHYKTICTEEQKQASINPENKSVYAQIFKDIQGCCVQFNNEMSAVKVHLPKSAAKSRSKRKRTAKSEQSEWKLYSPKVSVGKQFTIRGGQDLPKQRRNLEMIGR